MTRSKSAATENNLIEQAQKGDRSAFSQLVCWHYEGLMRVVYGMCGDRQMAEDVTQETFIKAWINLTSFQLETCLRNWLYRIAVNTALDILRRRSEEPIEEEAMQVIDQNPGPEATLIEKEQSVLFQRALKSLPAATRSVLVLREYSELSYQEIASVLAIPIGTVMSRLNYARNRLREIHKFQLLQTESEYV